jgi:hypothetical protein
MTESHPDRTSFPFSLRLPILRAAKLPVLLGVSLALLFPGSPTPEPVRAQELVGAPSGGPLAIPLHQEQDSAPRVEWDLDTEVGASVFFGASDQTTVATKISSARMGPRFEVEGEAAYMYGESTDAEGNSFVNKRFWEVGTNLNYRGFSRVNPYVFGQVLSSLEKKIDIRYHGGAGAKATLRDTDRTRIDLAVAVLAEMTVEDAPGNGEDELLARWTGSFKLRRSFSEERVVFETETRYNPVFDEFANYTISSESSLGFRLSEIISLKLSLVDNYDSRAEERGARSNNDGRVLFSVLASF